MQLRKIDNTLQKDFLRKQKRLRMTAIITAVWIAAIVITRAQLAPLNLAVILISSLSILSAIFTAVFANTARRLLFGEPSIVITLVLTLAVSLYEVGGIPQPVAAIGPAIPVLSTILISRRAGFVVMLTIIAIYLAFLVWQVLGLPLRSNPLGDDSQPIMFFLFLAFTASISFNAVIQYQTDAARREEDLNTLANHDSLTGLLNRRGLEKNLQLELDLARRYHHSLSLLFIDVDQFKQYNDSMGHLKGDKCLVDISAILNDILKRESDQLARIGGDEFIAILPNTPAMAAKDLAEEMRQRGEQENIHSPKSEALKVTITIGITTVSGENIVDAIELIDRADQGLNVAKKSGRNRVKVGRQTIWPASVNRS